MTPHKLTAKNQTAAHVPHRAATRMPAKRVMSRHPSLTTRTETDGASNAWATSVDLPSSRGPASQSEMPRRRSSSRRRRLLGRPSPRVGVIFGPTTGTTGGLWST